VAVKKHPGGRPKWIPTPEQVEDIETMAKKGLTLEQIAGNLGVSYVTLNARSKELPEILEALKRGKARAINLVAGKLYQQALRGIPAAMIFWLKNCAGWRDRQEHSTPPGQPFEVVRKEPTVDEDAETASVLDKAFKS